jgi:uncharacterized integral membrane protein
MSFSPTIDSTHTIPACFPNAHVVHTLFFILDVGAILTGIFAVLATHGLGSVAFNSFAAISVSGGWILIGYAILGASIQFLILSIKKTVHLRTSELDTGDLIQPVKKRIFGAERFMHGPHDDVNLLWDIFQSIMYFTPYKDGIDLILFQTDPRYGQEDKHWNVWQGLDMLQEYFAPLLNKDAHIISMHLGTWSFDGFGRDRMAPMNIFKFVYKNLDLQLHERITQMKVGESLVLVK